MWKRTETAQAMSIQQKFAEKLCFIHFFKRNTYFWMENYRRNIAFWKRHRNEWHTFSGICRGALPKRESQRTGSEVLFCFSSSMRSHPNRFSDPFSAKLSMFAEAEICLESDYAILATFAFKHFHFLNDPLRWVEGVRQHSGNSKPRFVEFLTNIVIRRRVSEEAKPSIHSVSKLHSG